MRTACRIANGTAGFMATRPSTIGVIVAVRKALSSSLSSQAFCRLEAARTAAIPSLVETLDAPSSSGKLPTPSSAPNEQSAGPNSRCCLIRSKRGLKSRSRELAPLSDGVCLDTATSWTRTRPKDQFRTPCEAGGFRAGAAATLCFTPSFLALSFTILDSENGSHHTTVTDPKSDFNISITTTTEASSKLLW